jgi:hypothetical protein
MLYDWNSAPIWANWGARDSNGFAHWFASLPHPYFSEFGVEWIAQKDTKYNGDCNPFWLEELHCPDAKLSLEARPTLEHLTLTASSLRTIKEYLKNKEVKYGTSKIVDEYLKLTDKLYRVSRKLPLDPLEPFLGKQISVERPNDTVIVSIARHKVDGRFSFVNHSKHHICTCYFYTILEAFDDLEQQRKSGKVISYKFI